jgi:hypothetical protein
VGIACKKYHAPILRYPEGKASREGAAFVLWPT